MKAQLQKKNLGIIAGIIFIIIIGITITLIQQGVLILTRARPTTIPERVQVTNVSDTSFTIVFTTGVKTTGAIMLPEGDISNTIILDDRDKASGIQNEYFSHHITVPNLKPQETYTFTIISNGEKYENAAEYKVTTGTSITTPPPAQNPLYGNLLLPDGSQASDTIVIAKTENSQSISAVSDKSGKYIIPTNSLRNNLLTGYLVLEPDSQIFITSFRENYQAKIATNFQIAQNLPPATLNQNYSFSPDEGAGLERPSEGFESIEEPSASTTRPSVTSPRENQSFVDQKPTFSGTGGANETVKILIPSQNLADTTRISSQGRWTYRPENNFSQGEHAVTFEIPDASRIVSKIVRNFSIFPLGSQIAESATPSATPAFTPTPTESGPTPTQGTASPTPTLEPTPETTSAPTATLQPTNIPTSTPLPPIEKPGDVSSTAIMGIFSIILIVAGAAIFFAL